MDMGLTIKLLPFLCLVLASTIIGQYKLVQRGSKYSSDMRIYFEMEESASMKVLPGQFVSPWHDIPLYTEDDPTNETLNMVVEIPRFSQAKFEIHREFLLNPIVQDQEDGLPRYLPNVFPWHGHLCNYGAFPQTWENPFHKDQWTGMKGDKDPIDVCEVGSRPVATGTVLPVKVLGILALLDSEETDWKVIALNSEEAAEKGISSIEDLVKSTPGLPNAVQTFFRVYKVPAGKGENKFAYNGEIQDEKLAMDVIEFTHSEWKKMLLNCSMTDTPAGSFNTHSPTNSHCLITQQEAKEEVMAQSPEGEDSSQPDNIDEWSFVETSASVSSGGGGSSMLAFSLSLFVINGY